MGGSAGGLLMGAVLNMRPDLFAGAVAQVPFVDVVTTMLDDAVPLTTGEYDEWGNPHERAAFDDILGYSPYDNVSARAYPALLVLAGLHDSQVQYWEPAKWVAKLRALKTDARPPAPQDEHGRRSRRRLRPLPPLPRDGAAVRLPAPTGGAGVGGCGPRRRRLH